MKNSEVVIKSIESHLNPIVDNLISINRNVEKGWYEIEIGIPNNWIFESSDTVECSVINKSEIGKILSIKPKKEEITLDDLVLFVTLIINTNDVISKKEDEFKRKMDEMKGLIEKQAKDFYDELDQLKQSSFKNFKTEISEKNEK